MIIFESPWAFLGLFIIPLIFIWRHKFGENNEGTLRFSSSSLISERMKDQGRMRIRILHLLQYITIALIIMGLSRPRLRDSLQETNVDVVDIVLVIDISSSMLATDFSPNRLEAVKKNGKRFY